MTQIENIISMSVFESCVRTISEGVLISPAQMTILCTLIRSSFKMICSWLLQIKAFHSLSTARSQYIQRAYGNATNPDCGEVCSLWADKVPLRLIPHRRPLPLWYCDAVGVSQIVHLEEPGSFNMVWKNNRLFWYGKMYLHLSKSSFLASRLYFWSRESVKVWV